MIAETETSEKPQEIRLLAGAFPFPVSRFPFPENLGPKVLALFVFALALWAQTTALVGSFYDDGIYVVLAKALAEGQGFRNIHLPDAPASVHYPILYPAMLSLLWRMWPAFPANVVLFQLFDAGVIAAAAWVIAATAARWPVPPAGRYAALVLGFSAFPLLTMIGVRFSEPLFLALALSATAAADFALTGTPADGRSERAVVGRRLWVAIFAGGLAGLCVLARSIGIAAVGGVTLALWFRRERRAAVVALASALIVVAPWAAWTAAHAHEVDPRIAANYGTYLVEARQAGAAAFLAGLDLRVLAPLARLTIPILPLWLWYPLFAVLVALLVWGAVRVAAASPALVGTVALYGLMVTLWPYVPDRFVWILLPVLALFLAAGAHAAWGRGRPGRIVVAVFGVVMIGGYARREVVSLSRRSFAATAQDASIPIRWLAPAIAEGTPRDAVIATEAEAGIYLYAGRKTVPSSLFSWRGRGTEELPHDVAVRYYCDAGVTHIALFAPEGGAAPIVGELAARGDSTAVPLFSLSGGASLHRFRCPF